MQNPVTTCANGYRKQGFLQGSFSSKYGVVVVLREISSLKEHEQVDAKRLNRLKERIKKDALIKKAIAVDINTGVVLDGHHRLNALKELGCKMIPAILVDYKSPDIEVTTWKKGDLTKEDVLAAGLSSKKFPPKTSKHLINLNGRKMHIAYIERKVDLPLSNLI
ncbi:MAG: ParB N-terminal domain-containing protein [Nitrososphaeria archaeon]